VAGELYDYLIALIITGVIFASAVVVVPNVSYVNLLYVDQQQLRNVALETLKAMLLDPGYPLNWGSDKTIQRFGLALVGGSSFYVLDPDKVQRLYMENPYYVDYPTTRELLNLRDYGFRFSIIPTFNVTISERLFQLPEYILLGVKVSRHDGRPVANAAVHATFLYSIKVGEKVLVKSSVVQNFTNPLGTCEVNERLVDQQIDDIIVVLRVTVADIATVVAVYKSIDDPRGLVDIWSVGDSITVMMPLEEEEKRSQSQEEDYVSSIDAYYSQEDIEDMYNGTQKDDKFVWGRGADFKNWTRTIPGLKASDPGLLIFTVYCTPKGEGKGAQGRGTGKKHVLIAGPSPSWMGFRVLNYGGTPRGTTARVQRNVIISGMTYLAEMILWKESL